MIDLGTLGGAYPRRLRSGAIGMRDLGTLGGSFSYGTAINANNDVDGYSTVNKVDSRSTETLSNPVFVLN